MFPKIKLTYAIPDLIRSRNLSSTRPTHDIEVYLLFVNIRYKTT